MKQIVNPPLMVRLRSLIFLKLAPLVFASSATAEPISNKESIAPAIYEAPPSQFHLFVPDQKNKELAHFYARETKSGLNIEKRESLSLPFAPATTAIHPEGKLLITTSGGKGSPFAASIALSEDASPRLIKDGQLPHPTGYTSIDRSGRFFLTANYRSGTISTYPINANGSIGKLTSSIKTPHREAHCILTSPDNRFAYIPCVKNNNAIFQYTFDSLSGELTPLNPHNATPPAMFGPRHAAYHPNLPIIYFSNEQQLGISVYEIEESGQLSDRQHATTIPRRSPYEKGTRGMHASDLAISPDGTLLFIAVRDFVAQEDSIFTFQIAPDGRLSLTHRTPVGDIPWKLALSPDGNYLLVSEITESRLSVFSIQPEGSLTPAAALQWSNGVRDFAIKAAAQ